MASGPTAVNSSRTTSWPPTGWPEVVHVEGQAELLAEVLGGGGLSSGVSHPGVRSVRARWGFECVDTTFLVDRGPAMAHLDGRRWRSPPAPQRHRRSGGRGPW